MRSSKDKKIEYGDFQTPAVLAHRVCAFLAERGIAPSSIIEPTCGTGIFILSALQAFPCATNVLGVEVNPDYLAAARARIRTAFPERRVDLQLADFFTFDWAPALNALRDPILVIGNPPWVTAAQVSMVSGANLPPKSNFLGLRGIEAKTGKSNFDIAEWMVIRLWKHLKNRDFALALLMKTSVARRFLHYIWSNASSDYEASLLRIDTAKAFNANADAGVLLLHPRRSGPTNTCRVMSENDWRVIQGSFGTRGGVLVGDVDAYDRTRHLRSTPPARQAFRWRSGVKHDCAGVLELTRHEGGLCNRIGEEVSVEAEWVFPLLKGSSIANGRTRLERATDRFLIIPQRHAGEDTKLLASRAPRLWEYLSCHRRLFQQRRSSIYRNRPPFAVFGVGPYTFQPWKVAICGLYKHFNFALVGPREGRPVVFDDTCYHLSFDSEAQARLLLELLSAAPAREFLSARAFWDAKRPVTAGLLQQLDLLRLADEMCRGEEWARLFRQESLFDTTVC